MTFVPNPTGLKLLFTNPNGGIARHLEDIGERIALLSQATVGVEYSRWTQGNNPPPGPPYRRTGDLQQSIRSTPAIVYGDSVEVNVVADPSHRGFSYSLWLRKQGYEFVDLQRLQI